MNQEELRKNLIKFANKLKYISNSIPKITQNVSTYKREESINSIKKILQQLNLDTLKENLNDFIQKQLEEINQLKEEIKFKFAKELEELLLKELNLKLQGNYPDLYAGLYHIKVEFSRDNVSIFWGPEFIKKTNPQPQEVVNIIKATEAELKTKPFDANRFFNLLYTAYKRVLLFESSTSNINEKKVEIIKVLKELVFLSQDKKFTQEPVRANFKEYKRIQFAYDLYRIKQVFKDRIILYISTFDATKDKEKSLFIPDTENHGTRYSYISIKG